MSQPFEPGTLRSRTIARTLSALQSGALQPFATEIEVLEEHGVHFQVRVLKNLRRKDTARQQQSPDFNPFLPYEADLFVCDLTDTHLCLLNKFNVIDNHLLIVTRAFEEQENWLTLSDFTALTLCLKEIDGLAFYNGGTDAGASQRHKHLQLIPFPSIRGGNRFPLESRFRTAIAVGEINPVPLLPFVQAIAPLHWHADISIEEAARHFHNCYRRLLQFVGAIAGEYPTTGKQSLAYNLLATREWMFLVPRSQEKFGTIGVNALGFAGALLVRDRNQIEQLREIGILQVLQQVATVSAIAP